jgi:hypothetical protein
MRRLPIAFALAVGVAATIGLAAPGPAAAEGGAIERREVTFVIDGITYFPCAGEFIEYAGGSAASSSGRMTRRGEFTRGAATLSRAGGVSASRAGCSTSG